MKEQEIRWRRQQDSRRRNAQVRNCLQDLALQEELRRTKHLASPVSLFIASNERFIRITLIFYDLFLHDCISCIYFVCNFFLNTENLFQNVRHNNLIRTIIHLDCCAVLLNSKDVRWGPENVLYDYSFSLQSDVFMRNVGKGPEWSSFPFFLRQKKNYWNLPNLLVKLFSGRMIVFVLFGFAQLIGAVT